jgi:hypothetical protein
MLCRRIEVADRSLGEAQDVRTRLERSPGGCSVRVRHSRRPATLLQYPSI